MKKAKISKAKRFAIFARQQLIKGVMAKDKKVKLETAEEVAYTWFNRFSAIRFMEVNGYLGKESDNPIFNFENGLEEFKENILKICHSLEKKLPGVFANQSDLIEKLFPDQGNTLENVINRMMRDIDDDQWHDSVETIGWLYQYYNVERKRQVFQRVKNNKRISKEDLPVATQLFTPEWLVEYMVENSLGRLWLSNLKKEPDKNKEKIEKLKESWKFYIPDEEALDKPILLTEIKIIDPCVGSGHILSYIFDFLMNIYILEGYNKEEAAKLIVTKNIFGLELDRRATQMAYFTVMMKGLKYDSKFLEKNIEPNVFEIEWNQEKKENKCDIQLLIDIKEYGSLLDVTSLDETTKMLVKKTEWGKLLIDKYHVVITNPPYMTMYNMSEKLVDYVIEHYPDGKHDLFAAYMEQCENMLVPAGYRAMVTQHSWMFLGVYEELRKEVLKSKIVNMIHLGARGFEEILGDVVQTVAFVTENSPSNEETKGCYKRLVQGVNEKEKIEGFFKEENTYYITQKNFKELPGQTISYWQSPEFFRAFQEDKLKDYYLTKKGMFTGNNGYFLKKWYEVPREKIGNDFKSYNKGGRFRKWYGCNDTVVRWHNDGAEIKEYKRSGNINENWYYKPCLSWNLVSTSPFCCRIVEKGAVMGDAGPICVIEPTDPNYYYLLGYLNSMVARDFLNALNPTINYPSGVVGNLPFKLTDDQTTRNLIDKTVKENIQISKQDWNNYETAIEFKENPLIKYLMKNQSLEESFEKYKKDANAKFKKLKTNEEKLNQEFIKIFQLEHHVDPKEDNRDVTLTYVCDDKTQVPDGLKGCRYVKYMENIATDFIAYIVGCLMSRFDFPEPEIILESQPIWYIHDDEDFVASNQLRLTTMGTLDLGTKLIHILDKLSKGNSVRELEFIKKALGAGQGKDPEKVLRNYLKKYFYRDHLKTYAGCPLYWQFTSGKYSGCKCLVYYHQFNEKTIGQVREKFAEPKLSYIEDEMMNIETELTNESVKVMRKRRLTEKLELLTNQMKEVELFIEHLMELDGETVDFDLGIRENYKKFSKVLDS